jgi:hypothetical protein
MPIYVAHFIVVERNLWYAPGSRSEITRQSERHRLVSQLFEATDAASAYSKANEMLGGLSDSHCDGEGERTEYAGIGMHELEEVFLAGNTLDEAAKGPYGVDVGSILWESSLPKVRGREQLAAFANDAA